MYKRLVTNTLFWAGEREPEYKERPEPKQRPVPTGEMNLVMRSRHRGHERKRHLAGTGTGKELEHCRDGNNNL